MANELLDDIESTCTREREATYLLDCYLFIMSHDNEHDQEDYTLQIYTGHTSSCHYDH